jgi:acetyltransferase EpsM
MQRIREERVLIIGAGGHGQVVADILWRMRDVEPGIIPMGFLDDRHDFLGQAFLGMSILGGIPDWRNIQHDVMVVAIGKNETRKRVFQLLQ